MLLLRQSHDRGAGKCNGSSHDHHHHHHHVHAHGKKGSCDGASASNHVHDHEGSCHASGVHKHLCSSTNVATRRCKPAKCSEEHSTSCRSKKCGIDPLVYHHQHVGCGGIESMKSQCCSVESGGMKVLECSSQGCDGKGTMDAGHSCKQYKCDRVTEMDDCCKSFSACQKDKCRDLEGQVASCLGDECVNEASSSEQSAKPASSCQHQDECWGSHADHEQISNDEIKSSNEVEEPSCSHGKNLDEIVECEARVECHHVVSDCHAHDHDHPVAHKHACVGMGNREVGSCCKSFIEECCRMHGHSPAHVNFTAGFGGLTEILSE